LAKYFAKRDIVTIGFDYRGFGRSHGVRGHIESIESHLSDCEKFINLSKEVYPETPFYAVGLSLGGGTAYHLGLKHKKMFEGSVLMAPALAPGI
jgi:alpha-beta hydrolase superfamily lysophospholipase